MVRHRPDCRTPQRPQGAASSSDYALSRARRCPGCRAADRCRGRIEQACRRAARAWRAVRCRRPRAVSGRRLGARRGAAAADHRSGLHHRRPPGAGAEIAAAVGRRAVGYRHRVRHHRRRRRTTSAWRSPRSAPTATTSVSRNPQVRFGDSPRRRPGAPRLHRERDGGARDGSRAARIPRSPKAVWPRCGPASWIRRRRRRFRSATTRCGCCAPRGSSRSSASR